MEVKKIGHVGIAAKEAMPMVEFFTEKLGGVLVSSEEDVGQQLISHMVRFGDCCLEIMETTTPDGVIGKFIEKRGAGLHHVSFKVSEIEKYAEKMEADGVSLVGKNFEDPALKYMFINPRSTGGVLVEMVESNE